jgi:hypothetical protein
LNWFERITGFREAAHAATQAALLVDGDHVVNRA